MSRDCDELDLVTKLCWATGDYCTDCDLEDDPQEDADTEDCVSAYETELKP